MQDHVSRRTFQMVCLSLGAGLIGDETSRAQDNPKRTPRVPAEPRVREELRRLLPGLELDDLEWLATEYGNTAINIVREHGRQGAEVLLALGPQGLAVLREQPDTFRAVADRLGGPTGAAFLTAIHPRFTELAALGGLPRLLDRFEALPREARRLGQQYPQMLPFLVLAPKETYSALARHRDLCLVCLPALDLSAGPDGMVQVCRLIARYGERARPWVEARGLDGLLLLDAYGSFLGRVPPLDDLPVFLTILATNQVDMAPRMAGGEADRVWETILELVGWDVEMPPEPGGPKRPVRGDFVRLACTEPRTLQFLLEHGRAGMRMIERTWPEAVDSGFSLPSLVLDGYAGGRQYPRLGEYAWEAFARAPERARETFQMLGMMAVWDGGDSRMLHPRAEWFRRLVAELGPRAVAYLANAECDAGSVEDRYDRLEQRREDELDGWENPLPFWVQQLPMYDAAHLAWLLTRGYSPSQGELLFAGIDIVFTARDLATLGTGRAAMTLARKGLRTANKTLARQMLSELGESVTPAALRAEPKRWGQRAMTELAGQLSDTPQVARELARRDLRRDMGVASAQAGRSADRMGLLLMATKVGRYAVKEWCVNMTAVGTLTVLVRQVDRLGDSSVFAVKAREALIYLNRILERPAGLP